jgi:hypothetical protein
MKKRTLASTDAARARGGPIGGLPAGRRGDAVAQKVVAAMQAAVVAAHSVVAAEQAGHCEGRGSEGWASGRFFWRMRELRVRE